MTWIDLDILQYDMAAEYIIFFSDCPLEQHQLMRIYGASLVLEKKISLPNFPSIVEGTVNICNAKVVVVNYKLIMQKVWLPILVLF